MSLRAFASDVLYPKAKNPDYASRKLALGILLQAFRDIVSPRRATWKKGEDWKEDALEWFASEQTYPGSFHWVCQMLQVSPQRLREWLKEYRTSGSEERKRMARKLVRFQIPRSA